jgi:hypothetical protein
MPNRTDTNGLKKASENSTPSLSRVDEEAIRSLARDLRAPFEVIAEIYRRELVRLATSARVKTFLPSVVSRLVRRRGIEGRLTTANAA